MYKYGLPLEEGMAAPPVFLPGESLWTKEPGALQSIGSRRAGHDYTANDSTAWASQVALLQMQET